ncbi:uncharacterized protein LOC133716232 [Rosa rugosa]|uniref:uncharacterized protein LOC133716232 n=1 Tax=Rosa rugosa TaxID=74645 RepID=UPI002B4059A6|nr:uncharacterized protein LOC133716232 [Rosa rugosa]
MKKLIGPHSGSKGGSPRMEKRKAQQERRKQNKYPHRLSRKGYAGLEEELANEIDDEEIDRATLWIKGRQSKNGNFKDEETKKTAEKIAALKKRVATGELSIEGSDDILTLALGSPEHGGRVRGVRGQMNPSTYFNLPKRRKQSLEATVRVSVQKILLEEKEKKVEDAREKIIEEAKEKIVAEERAFWAVKFAELEAKINATEDGNYVNRVDGKAIRGAFDVIEKRALQRKKKGTKVVKGVPLEVAPCSKVRSELTNIVENEDVDCALAKDVKETREENAVPNDIKEPHDEEEEQYVDLTFVDPLKKSPGDELGCKLAVGYVENIVAYATVMECDDPSQTIHGAPLGDGNKRVSIYTALDEKAKVPFPVKDEIETVKQAMGSWVAWPKELIITSPVKKVVMANAEKKRKKKVDIDEQDSEVQFSLAAMAPTLPESLKMLCMWGESSFRDGHTINFIMEPEVFGYSRKTFILGSDVRRLASMREVSGNCIAVYQR